MIREGMVNLEQDMFTILICLIRITSHDGVSGDYCSARIISHIVNVEVTVFRIVRMKSQPQKTLLSTKKHAVANVKKNLCCASVLRVFKDSNHPCLFHHKEPVRVISCMVDSNWLIKIQLRKRNLKLIRVSRLASSLKS